MRYPVLMIALTPLLFGCRQAPLPPAERQRPTTLLDGNTGTGKAEPNQQKAAARPAEKPRPTESNPRVEPTNEAGVIRGVVRWEGRIPGPAARPDECVVTVGGKATRVPPPAGVRVAAESRGVAGVMAWLIHAPQPQPPDTARLVQTRGEYRPLAQFVSPGSTLELRTADDEADFHADGVAAFSRVLRRGEAARLTLSRPGPVRVRSDGRAWMSAANLRVIEHGWHAVSESNGGWELPPVEEGEYDLMLWHPGWQADPATREVSPVEQRVRVKVAGKMGATVRWTLKGE